MKKSFLILFSLLPLVFLNFGKKEKADEPVNAPIQAESEFVNSEIQPGSETASKLGKTRGPVVKGFYLGMSAKDCYENIKKVYSEVGITLPEISATYSGTISWYILFSENTEILCHLLSLKDKTFSDGFIWGSGDIINDKTIKLIKAGKNFNCHIHSIQLSLSTFHDYDVKANIFYFNSDALLNSFDFINEVGRLFNVGDLSLKDFSQLFINNYKIPSLKRFEDVYGSGYEFKSDNGWAVRMFGEGNKKELRIYTIPKPTERKFD